VVKVGDRVKVKVIKLDPERRRIGLSIKQASEGPPKGPQPPPRGAAPPPKGGRKPAPAPPAPASKQPFNGIRIRTR
jgi:predicted RNA-binding protein with RPS1 domain